MSSASIDIPGSAKSLNSETDFVVISESPIVQLSDVDVLDGLQMHMNPIETASISIKEDIEKLLRDNDILKQTVINNELTMKKHIELCTQHKQQMDKRHEINVTMIEEARVQTLQLQKDNDALMTCLDNKQSQLEKAIITEYEMKKMKTDLEAEIEQLRSKLAECAATVEEAQQKAQEASFVQVDDGQETAAALRTEIEQLTQQLEACNTADGNTRISELEAKLSEAQEVIKSLEAANSDLKKFAGKIEDDHNDILNQISLGKAGFDEEREKKINELDKKVQSLEGDLTTKQKVLDDAQAKLTQANLEIDRLKEKLDVMTERKVILEASQSAQKFVLSDLKSQVEALKFALRAEQMQRERFEKDYASLLETWQSFERNVQRPVIELPDGTPLGSQGDVDVAAQHLAVADRLRLEAAVTKLRDTVRELTAENSRLLEQQRRRAAEEDRSSIQPSNAHIASLTCPLCSEMFLHRSALIQHAADCCEQTS